MFYLRILGLLLLVLSGATAAETSRSLTLGTGSTGGVYHPAGSAICRLFGRDYHEHSIRCQVQPSEGSVANLEKLRAGELDLAIVQSDWLHHAYRGSSRFRDSGPDRTLRTLFLLHVEPFTVIARSDSSIRTLNDLKGKRLSLGTPGSGQRATVDVLLKTLGWDSGVFQQALALDATAQVRALCDDEVDAIIYMVGHPNASVLEATTACNSVLIPVTGPAVAKLVLRHPYYLHGRIPGGMYRGNPDPIDTFGVRAVLVAEADLPDEVVRALLDVVFKNFDEFRKQHPALMMLDPRDMVEDGSDVPLHPAAAAYFREKGWLDPL